MFTAISSTHSDLWNIAGWTMIHFLWTGALVAFTAFIGKMLLKRTSPTVRYTFALTCLCTLTALPIVIALFLPLPLGEGRGEGASVHSPASQSRSQMPPTGIAPPQTLRV